MRRGQRGAQFDDPLVTRGDDGFLQAEHRISLVDCPRLRLDRLVAVVEHRLHGGDSSISLLDERRLPDQRAAEFLGAGVLIAEQRDALADHRRLRGQRLVAFVDHHGLGPNRLAQGLDGDGIVLHDTHGFEQTDVGVGLGRRHGVIGRQQQVRAHHTIGRTAAGGL